MCHSINRPRRGSATSSLMRRRSMCGAQSCHHGHFEYRAFSKHGVGWEKRLIDLLRSCLLICFIIWWQVPFGEQPHKYPYTLCPFKEVHLHTCSLDLFAGCVLSHFSRVWLFATLWAVACQSPLSMGFSRQEYWSGLLCPPPGTLPDPVIELEFSYFSCIGRQIVYH